MKRKILIACIGLLSLFMIPVYNVASAAWELWKDPIYQTNGWDNWWDNTPKGADPNPEDNWWGNGWDNGWGNGWSNWWDNGDTSDNSKDCIIKLNTNFPIIWNCIWGKKSSVNPTNAFPTMVSALMKIITSAIIVVCFILLIIAGIQISANKPKEGKALIVKVARTIALLWLSWVILRLVNPMFFG